MNQAAHQFTSAQLADYYQHACLSEIEAIKPGNVHIFADGHGMDVNDFVASAEASAAVIAVKEYGLGQRIYHAVNKTWSRVNCNTNLGIILLCAPIIQTALQYGNAHFPDQLLEVIQQTNQSDADYLFQAIRMANPAGLGNSDVHDVHQAPDCNLYEAMAASATRDLIGLQYQNGFNQLISEGLPIYSRCLQAWGNKIWAMTATYLYWLSHYPDSHIARKYHFSEAETVLQEAKPHYEALISQSNPKHYLTDLLHFDQSLKARHINPGTSADMTVATVLLSSIFQCINAS